MEHKISVIEFVDVWGGGIAPYITNIVTKIDKNKFAVRIICARKHTHRYDKILSNNGYYIEELLKNEEENVFKRTVKTIFSSSHYFKNNDADILHLHVSNGVQLRYAVSAKRAGVKKIIAHSHNTGFPKGANIVKKTGHILGKIYYQRYVDERIACSDLAALWLYPKKMMLSVKVIPCIVDIDKFVFSEIDRKEMRKNYNLENEIVILTVGIMNKQKNQIFLLQIYKSLIKMKPNIKLVFIGDGPLKEDIIHEAKKLNIYDEVIWINETDEIWKYMSMSDILLLPSLFEGNPLVGIEAQANGMQCFFSNTITKMAKVLDSAKFYSLSNSDEMWAEYITNNLCISDYSTRINSINIMRNSGYNVNQQIKYMETIYSY